MRKPNVSVPSYRHHKPSGQAVVTLSGQDHYLGRWDSESSKTEYKRRLSEWLVTSKSGLVSTEAITPIVLYDVTSDLSTLSSATPSVATYNDLGSGTIYGSHDYFELFTSPTETIPLDEESARRDCRRSAIALRHRRIYRDAGRRARYAARRSRMDFRR